MASFPTVAGDDNTWGTELNDLLGNVIAVDSGGVALHKTMPYRVRAWLTDSQGIPPSITTPVRCNTASYDPSSSFNASSGTFTVTVSGFYSILGNAVFDPASGGARANHIFVNETQEARGAQYFVTTSDNIRVGAQVSDILQLNAADVVTMRVFQGSPASLSLLGTKATTFFTVHFLHQ